MIVNITIMRKILKRKIEIYCAENEITQAQLCKKVGISQSTLIRWCNEKQLSNIDNLLSLMIELKLQPKDFEIVNNLEK